MVYIPFSQPFSFPWLGTKKNVFFWKETKQFFSFIFFVVPVFWRQTKHKTGTENRFLYPFSGTAKMKNTKKSVIFSFLGRPYLGQFLVSKKKTWCVRNLFTQSMQKLHFGKNGDGSVPRDDENPSYIATIVAKRIFLTSLFL